MLLVEMLTVLNVFVMMNNTGKMWIRTVSGWRHLDVVKTKQGFWVPDTDQKEKSTT